MMFWAFLYDFWGKTDEMIRQNDSKSESKRSNTLNFYAHC